MTPRSGGDGIDPDAFAALLCEWCLEVRPEQQVLIGTTTLAEPFVTALHHAIVERDAWPLLRLEPPVLTADFYRHARPAQLDAFAPLELTEVQVVDAVLRIDAPANTRQLAGIDPATIARAARARAPIQKARLAGRWCGTLWPTPALAQQAEMSESDYAAFVTRALFLDRNEPVAAWRELSERQQLLVEQLRTARNIRVEADGTDLSCGWMGGRGSTPTAAATCRAGRCSRGRWRTRRKGRSASTSPRVLAASR